MRKRAFVAGLMAWLGFLGSGCSSVSSYMKPEAPWGVIKRVAVLPFTLPSENPVQRELITKLFCEELRKAQAVEVVEVPLANPLGSGVWDVKQVGKEFKADAVVSGEVNDAIGIVVHIQVHDVATEDLLWSGTYMLGSRAEFFSFATQQQRIQRGFRWLAKKFSAESSIAPQTTARP